MSSGNSAEGDGGSLKNSDSPPRSPAGTTGGDGGGGGVAGASGTAPAASVSAHESLMSRDDLLAQVREYVKLTRRRSGGRGDAKRGLSEKSLK